MRDDLIRRFMQLAGQNIASSGPIVEPSTAQRILGAKLLLSEVLEFVIDGLGVHPSVNGVTITDSDALEYSVGRENTDPVEMIDGLADVAYTMYWNSCAFGLPLEDAFSAVCENNLEKFVRLEGAVPYSIEGTKRLVDPAYWGLDRNITWPKEVVCVEILSVDGFWYAVGKDASGKVRKPSSYQPVDLRGLLDLPSGNQARRAVAG
jgi:hypothetical protein